MCLLPVITVISQVTESSIDGVGTKDKNRGRKEQQDQRYCYSSQETLFGRFLRRRRWTLMMSYKQHLTRLPSPTIQFRPNSLHYSMSLVTYSIERWFQGKRLGRTSKDDWRSCGQSYLLLWLWFIRLLTLFFTLGNLVLILRDRWFKFDFITRTDDPLVLLLSDLIEAWNWSHLKKYQNRSRSVTW